MDTKENNNKVKIAGVVVSDFEFSHEVFGEGFYTMYVEVRRLSESTDIIPVTVSERIVDVNKNYTGQYVTVSGQFRSYNRGEKDSQKRRLVLYVFTQEVEFSNEMPEGDSYDANNVELDGFICKEVKYRKTPLGREIADVLLAVNRPYGKSDYIPCICWGRNAKYAEALTTGTHMKVYGRIQSRTYIKKLSETETEERTAYEVSLNKLKLVEEFSQENQDDEVEDKAVSAEATEDSGFEAVGNEE